MPETTELLSAQVVQDLYQAHGEELLRFLRGILRDDASAGDCLQITFTKLLQKGHETKTESRRAWLFRVAYQEAMLAKRKKTTTERVLEKAAWSRDDRNESRTHLPSDSLVKNESAEAIRAALAELPQEQQTIVRMRIYEDKTFAVIAEELNIPLGTALGRMRNALIRLRGALAGSETPEIT